MFAVDCAEALSTANVDASAGADPFGATFLNNGVLVVAEIQGGLITGQGRATASTYRINNDGTTTCNI